VSHPDPSPEAAPFPSSTVVVLRERAGLEVLLLRRSPTLAVHGGGWVFPGGRVEPGDAAAGDGLAALRAAACREAREEAGVDVAPGSVVPWSRWITPVRMKPRFDTWFFAASVAPDIAVTVDGGEIDAYEWLAPEAALEAFAAGTLSLMPPTRLTLLDLAAAHREAGSVDAMFAAVAGRELYPITPILVKRDERVVSLYPWDAEYTREAAATGESVAPVPAYLRRLPSRIVFR
jgi:8-oxo-dGTP pyrophosphatase MutT (NUDIX family)